LFNFQGAVRFMKSSGDFPGKSPGFLSTFQLSLAVSFCLLFLFPKKKQVVGTSGLEPPTSRLSGARSNQLSYAPLWWR
jgi:hypothetical protein